MPPFDKGNILSVHKVQASGINLSLNPGRLIIGG